MSVLLNSILLGPSDTSQPFCTTNEFVLTDKNNFVQVYKFLQKHKREFRIHQLPCCEKCSFFDLKDRFPIFQGITGLHNRQK